MRNGIYAIKIAKKVKSWKEEKSRKTRGVVVEHFPL